MAETTITSTENGNSIAEALYRFFTAYSGFDEEHTLGFEEESTAAGGKPVICAAVFSMEPALTQVRGYIDGGTILSGSCSIRGRVHDNESAVKREIASYFTGIWRYVTQNGENYADGGRLYRIRLAAHPSRVALYEDGAVWEAYFRVEIYETTERED